MSGKKQFISFLAICTLLFGFLATRASAASTEKVLYSFCSVSGCTDGIEPIGGLIFDAVGNLYGTAHADGAFGYGTVFQLTPGAGGTWNETVLYSFCSASDCTDGAYPFYGSLIFDAAGNLYGTTSAGGANQMACNNACGTVFELSPNGDGTWTETVLHSFGNGKDGWEPVAGLTFDAAGNLYGTTFSGGAHGSGAIFELTPGSNGTWTEAVLHSFCSVGSCKKSGQRPLAGVVLGKKGNLYGTTYNGGSDNCGAKGCGVVFQLSLAFNGTWKEKVLHTFTRNDGSAPQASLIFDGAGNLYGTTSETVFELKKNDGWTEKVLRKFGKGKDGSELSSNLVFDQAGNLYGTTAAGGTHGYGTVFELSPGASGRWTEKMLHSFNYDGKDGYSPLAGLIFDTSGNLYGTTTVGGTGPCKNEYGSVIGCGTVFMITP